MNVAVLCENTARDPALTPEHGLSLLVETAGRVILLDVGQSDAFAKNAERMGLSLADVDLAVLSHGHYDHGGGIRQNSGGVRAGQPGQVAPESGADRYCPDARLF